MKTVTLSFLKYSMFLFNLLIFMCGAAMLAVGIWVVVGTSSFKDIIATNPVVFNGVYIIIAVGALLFSVGFLGCCGAAKENKFLLGLFFVFVAVIFVVEVVGAILIVVYLPKVKEIAVDSIGQYNKTSPTDLLITNGWDTFQATIGCCGYKNYTDWKNSEAWATALLNREVPDSCCKRDILSRDGQITNLEKCRQGNTDFIHTRGCEAVISDYIWPIGGVSLGVLLLELIALIVTCCLYQSIR